jgi:carbon storage regulator CsrA
MLVLSRREGEEIVINERLTIRIVKIKGGGCRLAFDGPATDLIRRAELPPFELPPAINDTIERLPVAIGLPR